MNNQLPELPAGINHLTERVIGMAIEVHRHLGPGLLESIYEAAMCVELDDAGMTYKRQSKLPVVYKKRCLGHFKPDLIIGKDLVVEIKSVERHDPVFEAQILTYLRITGLPLGLLINFNSSLVTKGVRRIILARPRTV